MFEFYTKLLIDLEDYAQKCHERLLKLEERGAQSYNPNQPRGTDGKWVVQFSSNERSVNLLEEEAKGGHTLSRHVGKSETQLKADLQASSYRMGSFFGYGGVEIQKAAKSSYNSLGDANFYTNKVIENNRDKIDLFLKNPYKSDLWIESRFGFQTGYEAIRFSPNDSIFMRPTYAAGSYLIKDKKSKNGFRIQTSYPMNED